MLKKRTKDQIVEEKLSILIAAIEKVYPATPRLLWRSFLMGAFGALGASVGLAIIFTVLGYTLSQIGVIPGAQELLDKTNIQDILPTQAVR